jgi:ABC-type multidrug transport system fused ATPase/permease subunit
MNMKAKDTLQKHFKRTRFMADTLASSPAVLFVYTPLLVAQTAAGITVPFATGRFIDALVGGAAPWLPFAAMASLMLARSALAPFLQRLVLSRARNIELKLQMRVLDAAMDLSPAELAPLANGKLVAKLVRDAYSVGGFVSGLYPRFIVAVVTMFSAGAALYSRSAALGLAFMSFIPLAIAMFCPFAKRFAQNSRSVRTRSDGAYSTLFEFFHSLPFLRMLDAERRFADGPRTTIESLKTANRDMDRLSTAFGALLGAILVAGEIAVLGIAGAFAAKGAIPVGDVVVYQLLFLAAMQSVQGIVSLLPETASLREGIDSLGEMLSRSAPERIRKKTGAVKSIEFRNVTFSYPGAESRPVVKNFSAVFRAGRAYAFAGGNGAGKTTLLKLAIAALEPQAGEILVNGEPLKAHDQGAFRRELGIVFQDSLFVAGSLRDNITMRDPKFTGEDIAAAARQSGFDTVIDRLPDGLDTRISVCGQSLSGGELQRLAIARALVRAPSVIVLDEATNHLDAAARKAFAEMFRRLAKDRIVLIVSHDESIINLCDEKIFCQIIK